jgi:hypothetical protein
MPIEIKITDVYNLKLHELEHLYKYLKNQIEHIETVEPEVSKKRKKREPKYEEVIAFVLENTRTKKLTFDRVMEIVQQFEIPNLNALVEFPHLIGAVYEALRETVNE